jgi:competence protein ComEC
MKIQVPQTWGEFSGWLCSVFLIGIGFHSALPFTPFPPWVFFIFLCGPIVAVHIFFSSHPFIAPRSSFFMYCLLLATLTLGIWRFDLTIPRAGRYISSWQTARWILGKPSPPHIPILLQWREELTSRIRASLPLNEAALVSGMLYGDQAFTPEIKDVFRRAGLMHLVAVSGSNMTIVVTVLSAILIGMGLHRRHSFIGLTVGIAGFALFTGLSASVLRAAIMGWLVLCSRECGRVPRTRRLLLVAATTLTIVNPTLLVFDAGFALSFLATIGILEWTPIISAHLGPIPERFGFRESLATTLGAMLMTIPYLAWAFGQLSLVGVLTNLLALPLVSWIMAFGAITAAWGGLPGAAIISAPALGAARLILGIAHIADHVPWLVYRIMPSNVVFMITAYLLLWKLHRVVHQHDGLSTDDQENEEFVSV